MSMLRSDVQKLIHRLNGMFRVKAGRGWINWLLKVSYSLRGGMTSGVARSAVVCMAYYQRVYRSQGLRGLVILTKSLYVLTMQSVAGNLVASQALGPGVARSRDGLPRLIPRQHRARIRAGDRFLLRLWLSWFSIYRILEIPGALKLETITQPGVAISNSLWKEILDMVTLFCKHLGYGTVGSALSNLPEPRFFPLNKSTPVDTPIRSTKSSDPLGILFGAFAIRNSEVWGSFSYLLEHLDYSGPTRGLLWSKSLKKVMDECFLSVSPARLPGFPNNIGKLGFKLEAAGKVRVFAMVECWTQWLLWPIHSFVFKLLSTFPTDGTHDQLKPVLRLITMKEKSFWCFDLSAATDRLPVSVQSVLLDFLLGKSLGRAWANLLVGREYKVPKPPKGVISPAVLPTSVRYAVGQPMGALSSWAMLALTHHFIIMWAAFRVGHPFGSFTRYAVLGDDVVICDGKVAGAYLQLMAQLGVGVGIHKSLISHKGVLEFAKRFYVNVDDCAPVPFKEMVAATCDFEYSTEFIRKYALGLRSIAAFLEYGYKVRGRFCCTYDKLPKKLATVGIWRSSPWGTAPRNVSSWLNIKSLIIRPEWLVQTTEMWPVLPSSVTTAVKEMVSNDVKSWQAVRDVLPNQGSIYAGSKWLTKWFDDGLYRVAKSHTPHGVDDFGKLYNVLFAIQLCLLERSVPPLRTDLNAAFATKDFVSFGRDLDESKFLRWYKTRMETEKLRRPALLGERRAQKAKPSVLYATRLWRRMVSQGKVLS